MASEYRAGWFWVRLRGRGDWEPCWITTGGPSGWELYGLASDIPDDPGKYEIGPELVPPDELKES